MAAHLRNPDRFDGFSRWLNSEPGLQPSDGITVTDIDKVIHKFKTWRSDHTDWTREVQCMMAIEVKSFGESDPSIYQTDTLYKLHQLMATTAPFNFQNPSDGKIKRGHKQNNRNIKMRMGTIRHEVAMKFYGVFLLQMNGSCPKTSSIIIWGHLRDGEWVKQRIDYETLKEILRFDRHPISLRRDNPARPHKRDDDEPSLFD